MISIIAGDAYNDLNGNSIVGNFKNCKVVFTGKNAALTFSSDFRPLGTGCTIVMEDNSTVVFGKNTQLGRDVVIFARADSTCCIGDYASIGNNVRIYNRGDIGIGAHFGMRDYGELRVHGKLRFADWIYFQHHVSVYVPKNTELTMGKDSGMSWYSKILTGSGHSVYDLKHKIKFEELDPENRRMVIGDHVWIGSGAALYSGVKIGDGSVVASNSCVWSGSFDSNTMISGNPARSILRDITWDRRVDLDYPCFEEYKNSGSQIIERPAFFEEYLDDGVDDTFYIKVRSKKEES